MRLTSLLAFAATVCAAVVRTDAVTADESRLSTIPELSSTDFKQTTQKGYWFVKHYSPGCSHCKKLAPFWIQAGEKYESYGESRDFHLASVDCTINGDLCAEHEVRGYPTLYLYKDGERIDEYINIGSSDPLEPLSAFIEKHAGALSTTGATVTASTSARSVSQSQTKPTSQIASQPDFLRSGLDASSKAATTSDRKVAEADKLAPGVLLPIKDSLPDSKVAKPLLESDFRDSEQQTFTNPSGTSVNLTPETFTKLVTSTQDGWFIKFYAPWCGHCKAMAPAWLELANDFRGKMNIGEVNCEVEARLCKDIGVHGYPTLMFFQGEEHTEYSGLRGLGDLMAFANKAAGAGIRDVDSAAFEAIQKQEEVVFLYFYDSGTTSEDFEALQRTSLELIGHAPLLKTSSAILASRFRATTFPKLTVIRDGKPQYYAALGPADMRDHRKILAWMKSAWLPIVPELSAENSHEIMQNRMVVLAALDPESADFDANRQLLKDAAYEYIEQRSSLDQAEKQSQRDKKQIKIEDAEKKGDAKAVENAKGIQVKVPEHQEVGFAWVNGVFWQKWLAAAYAIEIAESGAKIIINEEDKKRYWDTTSKGSPITFSKAEILDTLNTVVSRPTKISPKSTKNSLEAAYHAARRAGTGHPFIMGSLFISLVAAILLILTRPKKKHAISLGHSDRERGGFFSGGNSNGKYD